MAARRLLAMFAMLGWLGGSGAAARGAVWVVAPDGDDAAAGGAEAPLRSVAAAVARVQPGDTVEVRAGVYRETVRVTVAGTPEGPVTIRGVGDVVLESPDPSASLSAFDVGAAAAHVRIEGFTLRGGFAETVFVRPGARAVELAGLRLAGNRAGIWIIGASDVTVRDCVIEGHASTGVRIAGGAQRVVVADTRAAANDDGAGCAGDADGFSADASVTDVRFERCLALANSEDGFDLQTPTATVRESRAEANGCSGIKLAAGGHLENVVVAGNRTGVNIGGAGTAATVRHATVLDNATGIRATAGAYSLTVRNSVVSGPGKALVLDGGVTLREGHNVWHRPAAKDRLIELVLPTGAVLYTAADINGGRWARETGQGDGSVAADPQLDPDTGMPAPGSPAVDSADAAEAAAVDARGVPRPLGFGPDRGAYEVEPPPTPAQSLRARGRLVASGTGRLRLSGEALLPPGVRLDPRRDPCTVTVSGEGGLVARAATMPAGEGRQRPVVVDEQGWGARLRWTVDGQRLRFSLAASDAYLAALGSGRARVTLVAGAVRVEGEVAVALLP